MRDFTRCVRTPIGREPGAGRGDLYGAAGVGRARAGLQPVRRVVDIRADREPIDRGPRQLAIDFPEVGVAHGEWTETEIRRADGAQRRVGEEKLRLVRVPVVDAADVKRELAEGQPNAAVDVEFSGWRGRQLGAPAPQAGIQLD